MRRSANNSMDEIENSSIDIKKNNQHKLIIPSNNDPVIVKPSDIDTGIYKDTKIPKIKKKCTKIDSDKSPNFQTMRRYMSMERISNNNDVFNKRSDSMTKLKIPTNFQ